jgi:hypothetical protein
VIDTTDAGTRGLPLGHVAVYLIGVAGLAFCITLLWFGMRAVMDLGGYCASGGPYQIAVECPDAVVASTPLSILGGFVAVGLMLWGGLALGASWTGLVLLAWPALFLSLGFNFLQYGFFPPDGGWIWSWILCGVLFVLMGGLPLLAVIGSVGDGDDGGRAYASGRVVVRPRPPASPRTGARIATPPQPALATPPASEPLVDRLERLADMRRRGDLTAAEYETAKAATLAETTAPP